MLCSVSHLGLDDFKKFISVFLYYTKCIPTISTKSIWVLLVITLGKRLWQTDGLIDRQTGQKHICLEPVGWRHNYQQSTVYQLWLTTLSKQHLNVHCSCLDILGCKIYYVLLIWIYFTILFVPYCPCSCYLVIQVIVTTHKLVWNTWVTWQCHWVRGHAWSGQKLSPWCPHCRTLTFQMAAL